MIGHPIPSYTLLGLGAIAALLASAALSARWPDWRWHHEPLHSSMEALGGLAAMAMATVLLRRREERGGAKFQALAVGFLGMGILDTFHAMVRPGNAFVLLRNVASLVGGAGFAFVWTQTSERLARRRLRLPWAVAVGALILGLSILAWPDRIPDMIRNGEFTPTAVAPQSLACLFFFAATLRLLLDYRRSGEPEDYLFACLALLFALAELVFMYSVPWDARWWFWHLLRLSACVLALGYVTCRYLRTISDLEASLVQTKRAEETLRRSEGQLRQALEDRERIAQDLHDGAIQSLFATTLSLERSRRQAAIDPTESVRQLDSAIADLKSVIRDLRGYLGGAEPPLSGGREFETALNALVATMEGPHRIHFDLRVSPAAADRVTPGQAAHLLAIAREAMSNCLRHSAARTGTVSLYLHDGNVRLVVEDDGVGFQTGAAHEQGHGLRNMDARARKLGGRLTVHSEPGRGTRIVCDVP
ncbi:MAG TPA: sensor histidine kinase [Nitrospiraceae bacterium]|jgi:signal transduction histidine kinase|nr:sensor histidine kinase [Nitrospiraceae bacterium]